MDCHSQFDKTCWSFSPRCHLCHCYWYSYGSWATSSKEQLFGLLSSHGLTRISHRYNSFWSSFCNEAIHLGSMCSCLLEFLSKLLLICCLGGLISDNKSSFHCFLLHRRKFGLWYLNFLCGGQQRHLAALQNKAHLECSFGILGWKLSSYLCSVGH